MGGLGMIWNPYGFFGAGGLTKWPSDGIMRAKTAAPPYISDTFSDTIGDIQIILNNFSPLVLSIHHKTIFFITFNKC